MVRTTVLAGIDPKLVSMFGGVLSAAGAPAMARLARLDVPELGRLFPDVLVCDIDNVDVDPFELLRRIRFVLPDCMIAVYTGVVERTWGVAAHRAGANCLLSKGSTEGNLSSGVRAGMRSGCYTDPRITT
jgi:DNA-binding NarL/FixJ family response regulator